MQFFLQIFFSLHVLCVVLPCLISFYWFFLCYCFIFLGFMYMKIVLCFVLHIRLLSEAIATSFLLLGWSFHPAGVFESCLLQVFWYWCRFTYFFLLDHCFLPIGVFIYSKYFVSYMLCYLALIGCGVDEFYGSWLFNFICCLG